MGMMRLMKKLEGDQFLLYGINKILMDWNPIGIYCIPEIEYECEAIEIYSILKNGYCGDSIDGYFNAEYFEINSICEEKQNLLPNVKKKLEALIVIHSTRELNRVTPS